MPLGLSDRNSTRVKDDVIFTIFKNGVIKVGYGKAGSKMSTICPQET